MNFKPSRPEQVVLTEFQKLIVNCKPEMNKPVFILSGRGSGVTFALNERAKYIGFLYYHPNFWAMCGLFSRDGIPLNLNSGKFPQGYEEVAFENHIDPDLILSLIPNKRIIVCTNGVDFVEKFANNLKGQYTIISGFNVIDNPYLDNTRYAWFLRDLNKEDKKRLYYGNFKQEE